MPLGVSDMPVLDPSVRRALLALGVHVRLTITVDSAGHTKNVAFQPPLDAGARTRYARCSLQHHGIPPFAAAA